MSRTSQITRHCDRFGCPHSVILGNNDQDWYTLDVTDSKARPFNDKPVDLCRKCFAALWLLIWEGKYEST